MDNPRILKNKLHECTYKPAFLTSLQWCRCAESKRRCILILQVQLSKAYVPLEACPQGKVLFDKIVF